MGFRASALIERREPLWADLRKTGRALANERLRLIAAILGLSFDALKQRDAARRRARVVQALAACAVAAVLALFYVLTLRNNPMTMALAWTGGAPVPTTHSWDDRELFTCPDCYYETYTTAATGDGKIFLLGGAANVRSFEAGLSKCFVLDGMHAFDPSIGRWQRRRSMPTARSDLAAAYVDGMLYAAGGNVPQRTGACVPTNAFEAYDPKTDRWIARAPMPEARVGFAAIAASLTDGGRIFVFGGTGIGGQPLRSTYAYDPQSNRWRRMADLPHTGFVVAGALVGNLIYAVGALGDPPMNAIESYDTLKGTWSEGEIRRYSQDYAKGQWFATAYAPGPRVWKHPRVSVVGYDLYVLEGASGDSLSATSASNLDIYRTTTGTWGWAPSLPANLGDVIASASLGGEFYAYTFALDLDAHSYVATRRLTPWRLRF